MYILFVLLALLLLPIPLYTIFRTTCINEKNRHGNLAVQRAFKKLIYDRKLTISEVTKFLDRLIAIDQTTGRLVFVAYTNDGIWKKCIGLEEIKDCETVIKTDALNGYIQKVTIDLTLISNQEKVSFPFFDHATEDVRDLTRRSKQARYWHNKIHYYLFDHAGRFQWKCSASNRNVAVATSAIIDTASGGSEVK